MQLLLLIGIAILHLTAADTPAGEHQPVNVLHNRKYRELPSLSNAADQTIFSCVNTFAGKLIKSIAEDADESFVCSPIGVTTILSMAAQGARGHTELAIRGELELPPRGDLDKIGFQNLIDNFTTYTQPELRIANGLFVSKNINPQREFVKEISEAFRSEVQTLDFSKPEIASDTINAWFEDKTNRRIEKIVNPDDLSATASLVLANAMYFKGTWRRKFDSALTADRTFYVDGIVPTEVPTMVVKGTFNWGFVRHTKARFIELPYKSVDNAHDVSMFIILPFKKDGLSDVEKNLEHLNLQQLIDRGEPEKIRLVLPKFKIESQIDLKEPLKRLHFETIFGHADFTGIVPVPPLTITKIVQKAVIEIDEDGSEAAASTGMIIQSRSYSGPIDFVADHPFIAIIATRTQNPVNLFTLRYNGQTSTQN